MQNIVALLTIMLFQMSIKHVDFDCLFMFLEYKGFIREDFF